MTDITNNLELVDASTAVEQIAALAVAAKKPGIFDFPGADDHRCFVIEANGSLGEMYSPPRSYQALSLQGLIDQINDLSVVGFPNSDGTFETLECRVFVGNTVVQAILDERVTRVERMSLRLRAVESVQALQNGFNGLKQAELEWKLRSLFPGRISPETMLPTIRKLKFRQGQSGGSAVEHGNETVDMEVEASIAGIDQDIPDEIVLSTPVFDQLAALESPPLFPVRCAVHIDVQKMKFTIKPLEGEIIRVFQSARSKIVDMLEDAALPSNVKIFRDSASSL